MASVANVAAAHDSEYVLTSSRDKNCPRMAAVGRPGDGQARGALGRRDVGGGRPQIKHGGDHLEGQQRSGMEPGLTLDDIAAHEGSA